MLTNLTDLFDETKTAISNYLQDAEEVRFTEAFKTCYSKINPDVRFFDCYAVIPTASQKIIAPSIWFTIAEMLVPFLEALRPYRDAVSGILEANHILDEGTDFDKWAKDIKARTRDIPEDFKKAAIKAYGETDSRKIFQFLTNYQTWGGAKSVGRTDYYASPLLKASGLVNESSGHLSAIVIELANNSDLRKEVRAIREQGSRHRQKRGDNKNLVEAYHEATKGSGLKLDANLITRFLASLASKPFVILSGLSGSGKTKLAQSFAMWISNNKEQYSIIPVGADWTNREPLLGFPNALDSNDYVKPDNNALDLILKAINDQENPYFLILDEMNLSHVERYFADFLSAMESAEPINLHTGEASKNGVPAEITLPPNLFIIGTVNIDETTYMFSPKVLDRANVIEFRITQEELSEFLNNPAKPNLQPLAGKGSECAAEFLALSSTTGLEQTEEIKTHLLKFFIELKKSGAEFGYRSASEISQLMAQLKSLSSDYEPNDLLDIAIMQKLLPRVHGSRRKLEKSLSTLASFCVADGTNVKSEFLDADTPNYASDTVLFPVSLEKLVRMYKGAMENGFASYAEA